MDDDPAPAAPPHPVRPLLVFDDPWDMRTRGLSFEGGVVKPGEIMSLNHIRDMTGQRNIACVREGSNKASFSRDQIEWFRKYLSNLAYLTDQEGDKAELQFQWTSPLSGRGGRFFWLQGLMKEQAMAITLYAALLRQLAHQCLNDVLGSNGDSSSATSGSEPLTGEARVKELTEAATLLRKAAGVYAFLAERMLPPLQQTLRGDRPGEIMPPLASCMQHVALGEAQALAAFRAEERKSSPAVVASLHAGTAELFEKAAKILRDYTGDYSQVSDRLKRFLALSASISTARAHKAHAADLWSRMDCGVAARGVAEATAVLTTCQAVADVDQGWKGLLSEETAALEPLQKGIENDRLYVTCQAVPREVAKLPAAKVLVTPIEYQVERLPTTAAELALQQD